MNDIKKGDIVARKSHNKDVIFIVDVVINNEIAILSGITTRLKADSNLEDLEKVDKAQVIYTYKKMEARLDSKINKRPKMQYGILKRSNKIIYTGRILHLDGDTHLSDLKKYSNINTSKQVIFNHNKNNVSKIKIHYFFNFKGKPRVLPVDNYRTKFAK